MKETHPVNKQQQKKRTRKFKATPLQSLTKPLLTRAIGKSAPALLALVQGWRQIAPAEFVDMTRAVKIRFPNRNLTKNGTLDLEVLPEAAFIVQHSTSKLIHAVNLYFGYPAISKVNIRQVTFKQSAIATNTKFNLKRNAEPLANIKDPALAQSLANLAALVKKRQSE